MVQQFSQLCKLYWEKLQAIYPYKIQDCMHRYYICRIIELTEHGRINWFNYNRQLRFIWFILSIKFIVHSFLVLVFSSRTPNPKLLTAKLEGTGTNTRPRIRPQEGGRRWPALAEAGLVVSQVNQLDGGEQDALQDLGWGRCIPFEACLFIYHEQLKIKPCDVGVRPRARVLGRQGARQEWVPGSMQPSGTLKM